MSKPDGSARMVAGRPLALGFRVRARERQASALCLAAAAAVPAAMDQVEQGRAGESAARVRPVAAAALRRVAADRY